MMGFSNFYFEIIAESHAVIRIPVILSAPHPVFPKGDILLQGGLRSTTSGELMLIQSMDHIHVSLVLQPLL